MTHSEKCPICSSPATIWGLTQVDNHQVHDVLCIRCGKYSFTWELDTDTNYLEGGLTPKQIAILSAVIYRNPKILLTDDNIDRLLDSAAPSVGARAEELLVELGSKYPDIGEGITNTIPLLTSIVEDIESGNFETKLLKSDEAKELIQLLPITWSTTVQELEYLLMEYLVSNSAFLEHVTGQVYRITPKGWERINSLANQSLNSKQGFVAMDFSEDLKHIYFNGIKLGFEGTRYSPKIMHDHHHNNWIADEIMVQIRRSRFVIADVTKQNRGVYFEAGFALGLGIPVVWICNKKEFKKRHFDTAQINTIKYSEDDLPSLAKALKNRILNTIPVQ